MGNPLKVVPSLQNTKGDDCTGVIRYITNPNNARLYGKSLKTTIFALFDPPKMGNLTTPGVTGLKQVRLRNAAHLGVSSKVSRYPCFFSSGFFSAWKTREFGSLPMIRVSLFGWTERCWQIKQIIDGDWYKCDPATTSTFLLPSKKFTHGALSCLTTHFGFLKDHGTLWGKNTWWQNSEYFIVLPRIFRLFVSWVATFVSQHFIVVPFLWFPETFRIPAREVKGSRILRKECPWEPPGPGEFFYPNSTQP